MLLEEVCVHDSVDRLVKRAECEALVDCAGMERLQRDRLKVLRTTLWVCNFRMRVFKLNCMAESATDSVQVRTEVPFQPTRDAYLEYTVLPAVRSSRL